MDFIDGTPGVARGMDEYYLGLRMIDQETKEFAGSIAGTSYDAYFHSVAVG